MHGFHLTDEETFHILSEWWNPNCEPPWSAKELRHKIESARSKGSSPDLAGEPLRKERQRPGNPPSGSPDRNEHDPGYAPEKEQNQNEEEESVASAADLIKAGVEVNWMWENWIPRGVLTCLAAEPGVGKTRFCADLTRRIQKGLPWPDGTPMGEDAGKPVLWVASDNQHAEIASLPIEMNIDPSLIYINASVAELYSGTVLDSREELKALERRILKVKPAVVFVDTCMGATEKGLNKTEDARAFFAPLQQIAARTNVCMLAVTHLNANGTPLGRRIVAAVRSLFYLERPDPEGLPDRRKLVMVKSFRKLPPPLGVTMYSHGNEYDKTPPSKPDDEEPGKGTTRGKALTACIRWLSENLPGYVGDLRKAWEAEGLSTKTMYRAMEEMEVVEEEMGRRKHWSIPTS